jgi:hypothetical protein
MSKLFNGFKITSAMTFMVLLIGAYQPASAQMVSTSGARAELSVDADSISPAAPAVAPGHVLVNTYLRQGAYNALVPAGTAKGLDKVITINCPKGPCSISAVLAVQSGQADTVGNQNAIAFGVDGTIVNPCFIYGATTPSDGSYVNTTQTCSIGGLATGHHTLQIYFYSINGADVFEWAAAYTLYEP